MLAQYERLLEPLLDTVSDLVVLVDERGRIIMFNRACETVSGYRREEVLGSGLIDQLVPAAWAETVRRRFVDPFAPQVREPHENPWVTKGGEERMIRWRCTAVQQTDGAPPCVLGIGTDVTEQLRLDRRLRAQSRLSESFFDSTLTCIVLLDRNFNFLRVNEAYARACRRTPSEFIGRNHFELYPSDAREIFEEVVHTKQPYQARARAFSFPDHPEWGVTYWDWMLTPVVDEHGEIEVLVFCLNDVTEHQRQLDAMRVLSHQIAEAQERERWRIGLDLHDEVGQGLTAIKLGLRNAIDGDRVLSGAGLARTVEAVDDLIQRVRRIALDLHPPMLDDLGLLPALLWLFDRYQSDSALHVNFKQSGLDRRLPPAVETAAYRIVQEALTNVARHAEVAEVKVLLRVTKDSVLLKIEDRGTGFESQGAVVDGKGSGLLGMRERARLLDGKVTIESAPAAGTAITAELPLVPRS